MIGTLLWTWDYDGWIVLAGVLCATSSALLGAFMVLRRMSMLGDAISHAVLPGIAAAFLLTGSRSSLPMFIGAAITGVLTAVFTQWIRGVGKVDEGASMGVVFTALFAAGLLMVVRAADAVDLDPGCVLYGAIELTPLDRVDVWGLSMPRVVLTLGIVTVINMLFVVLFFKELKLTSFDPALATTLGFRASWIHYLLMTLVAVTAVASFETVGNILVVAMLVAPAAAAYMLTDRLAWMILLAVAIGSSSALLGHATAIAVPGFFGFRSTTTAGSIAACAGLFFAIAAALGPRHGVIVRTVRRRWLSLRILCEDIIALLYRTEERHRGRKLSLAEIRDATFSGPLATRLAVRLLRMTGAIESSGPTIELTSGGRARAVELVRTHRLWEQYLSTEADVDTELLHEGAERLEHFTNRPLQARLRESAGDVTADPHGSPIPPEESEGSGAKE